MKNLFASAFCRWLPFAVTVTVLCGLICVTVQQDMRQGANDPQIQMAEDAARTLGNGASAHDVVLNFPEVDIALGLSPYIMIFDEQGNALASSANIHGQMPAIPAGVFDVVRRFGERRFTWAPERQVRMAVVMAHFSGQSSGFVLAGRSLREVERRESWLTFVAGLAWTLGLVGTFLAVCIDVLFSRKSASL
jgi:hypothetical protein